MKSGRYRHFKGGEYEVLGTAKHSETLEEVVIYRALYGESELWVRPLSMWNDIVEHNGCSTKRFTHIDELEDEKPTGIHNHSTSAEKIELFMSLFCGHNDIYATRYEAKNGSSGYSPVCNNRWSAACPKTNGLKTKCGECSSKSFAVLDEKVIEKHLTGKITAAVYPMFPDDTCHFIVMDFDSHDNGQSEYEQDVKVITEVCKEFNISYALERSRSGNGAHLWLFFSENVPAVTARKLCSSLLTYAMSLRHEIKFSSYDRIIPCQDTMPKGGFGNMIALPLQKKPRANANSVFVDSDFVQYRDPWSFLSGVQRYNCAEVESFIKLLSHGNELGALHKESENTEPWESKEKNAVLQKSDFPDSVSITRANMLYITKEGLSSRALNCLKRLTAFKNPEFYKAQAMRLSTYNKPRIISISDEDERYLFLPRGLEDEVTELFKTNGVRIKWQNKQNKGRKINVSFNGTLREEQETAASAMLKHNNGILSAATAFGKTVVGAKIIAERKVNTLILVHRTQLLEQWAKSLSEFLTINEVLPEQPKKRGKKKQISIIGRLGGGKNQLNGIVDIAVIQSLVSDGEVKDLVKDYGMIIVDECHHISAFSFESVLRAATAQYVYGLTATPTRQDGHHPIIYMQCGKIRYRVDAKKQAEARPFEHYVIPRFTSLKLPSYQTEEKITAVYDAVQSSEIRNQQIVEDVLESVKNGRNPIVLTERTGHVEYLTNELKKHLKNVIPLTGGLTAKKSRELLLEINEIPKNESLVLVATGKYVGEGFDFPRLDTLLLAMPISWKGTLQQYAGRLHRLYDGKNEVQIYDYIDIHVSVLEKMYQKRLKGYSAIGYKTKGSPKPLDETSIIFDSNNFLPVFANDILQTKRELLIVSPFLTKRRINAMLKYLNIAKTTVVTRPAEDYSDKDAANVQKCIELLGENGITVKTKPRIHQKFAAIDSHIVWYGSINLLSYGFSEESIMRLESEKIANELMGSL